MDPPEVEFLAEKEMVKIIPNFSLDKIYLIGVSKYASYSMFLIRNVIILSLCDILRFVCQHSYIIKLTR